MKSPFYKKWWFIILAIFIALAIIGSLLPDSETTNDSSENSETTDEVEKAPAFEIEATAQTLYENASSNEVSLSNKVKNKRLKVTGVVSSIGYDIFKKPYLAFKSDNEYLTAVQCYFNDEKELEDIQAGQEISVYGYYDSFMISVLMKKCSLQEYIDNVNEQEREALVSINSQNTKRENSLKEIDKDITSKFNETEMLLKYPKKYINDIHRLLNEYSDIIEQFYPNIKTELSILFKVSGDELEKQTNDNFKLNYLKYSNRFVELSNEFITLLNEISPSPNPPSANPPETIPNAIDIDEINEVGTKVGTNKGDKYPIKDNYKGYFIKALFKLSADNQITITMTNRQLAKMFEISDKTISKALNPNFENEYQNTHNKKLAINFIKYYNILDLFNENSST